MFCDKCGKELPENAKFCASCGAKTESGSSVEAVKTTPIPVQQTNYNNQFKTNIEPLTVKNYLGMLLLMIIPIVNIILLFVWGFDSTTNLNKSNFAKAYLILILIGIGISIICGILFSDLMVMFFSSFSEYTY